MNLILHASDLAGEDMTDEYMTDEGAVGYVSGDAENVSTGKAVA